MTPETSEKQAIRQQLAFKGYFTFPILQGLGCFPGVPDLVCIKDGKVILIEVKVIGKRGKLSKQSDIQKEFQSRWEEAGGTYICGNFETVMEKIK